MKFTPGLSSNHRDSERYTFYARGFQIQNFQYDGIPAQIANESQQFTSTLADMAIYDRVEVVRGATGLLSGAGTPSATLNLVRKRPTEDAQATVAGEVGSWDRYRTEPMSPGRSPKPATSVAAWSGCTKPPTRSLTGTRPTSA